MGGFIALELTLRCPDLVEKLVLVATSAGGRGHTQPSLRFTLMAWALLLRLAKSEPGERMRQIYARIMAPGYAERQPVEMERIAEIGRYRPISQAAYNRQLQTIRRYDVSRRLGEIHAPTLVIHGEDDPLVPAKNGRDLARAIKGARLVIYPDTGHIPIVERAEQFNRDVLAFLE
jgi:pimeloyl-ACP methyl ester carboxylesterase